MNVYALAGDSHYVVTKGTGDNERVVFGWTLPLTKRAALGFAKSHGGRVIMRKTAVKGKML